MFLKAKWLFLNLFKKKKLGILFSNDSYLVAFLVLISLGTPVSFTNKTDRHDITEILLKVALNTINQTILVFLNPC